MPIHTWYLLLVCVVGICWMAPTQIRTFGLTIDPNSHALHGECGKELVMLNDRLISASLVASDVRRIQSLSSFHTLEHPKEGLTMIYEFSKCRWSETPKEDNQPSPARKTSGWFNPQWGGLHLLTFSGRCCYSRREDLGMARIMWGPKKFDHLDRWFIPSFGPGPLLFLRSFCCCDVLLLVLGFANMDVSSLGKLQWCFNYGCNMWTVDISTEKTYLACY